MNDTCLIIGASTGIGLSLAKQLKDLGHTVIALSRKPELLEGFTCYQTEGSNPASMVDALKRAVSEHPAINKVFMVAGMGDLETDWTTDTAIRTLSLNCEGFTLVAYTACQYLEARGRGHFIGVTSVAGIRGGSQSLSYNASKAYQSNLLEGLRCKFHKTGHPLLVTEVRPGFVDTTMMKADKPFWVCTPQKAAAQIIRAVARKKDIVYISRRWILLGSLLKWMPLFIYKRIG